MLRGLREDKKLGWVGAALLGWFTLAAFSANAAIFPDEFAGFKRMPPKSLAVPDQPLFEEYGLETTEQVEYVGGTEKFTATAWRLKDSTCAMAVFQARRPPGAQPSALTRLSVTTSDGLILAHGNYVFQFTGRVPKSADLNELFSQLPRLEQSPLPTLMTYLPAEGLVPNSERYVVGPVSLERFEPRIPPSTAAFHLGAEGQTGKYSSGAGLMTLTIFNYPTPNMARERSDAFQQLTGAVVKRTGSLVAVILSPPDPDAAERVLAKISQQANLTWHEKAPDSAKGWAGLILGGFVMAGLVVLFAVVAGLAVGGVRIWVRRIRKQPDEEPMITLNLGK